MHKVYISGGRNRQSIRGPDGKRWTKDMLRPKLRKYGFDLQTAPTKETAIVILPDNVRNPSKTTRSKIERGTRVMRWDEFAEEALGYKHHSHSAHHSASSSHNKSHKSKSHKSKSHKSKSHKSKSHKSKSKSGSGMKSMSSRSGSRSSVCAEKLRKNIEEMMRELRDESRWVDRKQALAVAYAKTRKESPRCKAALSRK